MGLSMIVITCLQSKGEKNPPLQASAIAKEGEHQSVSQAIASRALDLVF